LCVRRHEEFKKETILAIDDDALVLRRIKDLLLDAIPNVEVITTQNPLHGISLFKEIKPCMVLIDADMPTINGFNVCSIIRDMDRGDRVTIYMVTSHNDDDYIYQSYKVGFNCYFDKAKLEANFINFVKRFFERKTMAASALVFNIEKARNNQEKMLPKKITAPNFLVDYIYSPYQELSGDFIDYWGDDKSGGLYGYIFDVAGHDISSSLRVAEVRTLFKYGFKSEKEMDGVLSYVNNEIIALHEHDNNDALVAGVAFWLDFNTMQLSFCSAGVPCFYVVSNGNYEEISMAGFMLGYKKDAEYIARSIKVTHIDEIIFSSDGFSDMFLKNSTASKEIHDDVSAIMIHLTKNR